jgi:hypothetical protein
VAFCHELGLDYVSCSPYRVPIARLAAAQAAVAVLEREASPRRARSMSGKPPTSSLKSDASTSAAAKSVKKASSKQTSGKKTVAKKVVAKKKPTSKKTGSQSRTRKKPAAASRRR